MKDIKVLCNWELSVDIRNEKQIELWVDKYPHTPRNPGVIRICVLIEPQEIRNSMGLATITEPFDYILTHDQSILDQMDNAFLYEFGGCWVRDYSFAEKIFGVSTLIGGKKMAAGHHLRLQLFNREEEIRIPKTVWISKNFPPPQGGNGNPILSGPKSHMFNKQFHICIENVKRKNWFTEKLIDCLYTKTVPIYYGCPNIGDWFDVRGFIVVNNVSEMIEACNSLTPESYSSMLEYIENNHEESKKYLDVGVNIKRSIEKNILPLDN